MTTSNETMTWTGNVVSENCNLEAFDTQVEILLGIVTSDYSNVEDNVIGFFNSMSGKWSIKKIINMIEITRDTLIKFDPIKAHMYDVTKTLNWIIEDIRENF